MDAFNIGTHPRCPDDLDTVMRSIAGVWECPTCGGQSQADVDFPQPKVKRLADPRAANLIRTTPSAP